jgi:hypothetical protein
VDALREPRKGEGFADSLSAPLPLMLYNRKRLGKIEDSEFRFNLSEEAFKISYTMTKFWGSHFGNNMTDKKVNDKVVFGFSSCSNIKESSKCKYRHFFDLSIT